MKITEQQMFDYITCPAKYDIKYNKRIDIRDEQTLPKLLNKVAKFFYLNLFNGKVCTANELKAKWDSVCKANMDFIDAKKNLAGWGAIINLLNWAQRNQIVILDVDTTYSFVVDNVEILGQMDPILAIPGRGMELLITNFSDRLPDQIASDMKLKYSLDSLAFEKVYNKELEGIRIHSVKADKDLFTRRGKMEYKRLEDTITSVAKGIENNIFYPREGPLCSNCSAKEYCKFWSK